MSVPMSLPDVVYNSTLRDRIHDWLIQLVVGKRKGVIMNVQLSGGGDSQRVQVRGEGSLLSAHVTYPGGIVITVPREVV